MFRDPFTGIPAHVSDRPASEHVDSYWAIAQARLIRVFDQIALWQERARSRRQMLSLDSRMLHDVGIDPATARTEATKPFWKR